MSKFLKMCLGLMVAMLFSGSAFAQLGFPGESFTKVKYYAFGGTGSGESASNPAAAVDGDVVALPAGALITKAYVIVDTAITGTSAINVGDDDDNDGYVTTASITLGTPGLYGYASAAAYLASGAAKLYVATGKEVKLDVTGTNTAGAFRVVIQGHHFGR